MDSRCVPGTDSRCPAEYEFQVRAECSLTLDLVYRVEEVGYCDIIMSGAEIRESLSTGKCLIMYFSNVSHHLLKRIEDRKTIH